MLTSVIAELQLLHLLQKRSENNLRSSFSTEIQPENSDVKSLNSLKEAEPLVWLLISQELPAAGTFPRALVSNVNKLPLLALMLASSVAN